MGIIRAGSVSRISIALALATVLAGCTSLTDEMPDHSSPAPNPTQSTVDPGPAEDSELPSLEPGTGEVLSIALTGKDGLVGTKIRLENAETFVSWTCVGTGQFRYILGNESSVGDCQSAGRVSIQRNESTTTKTQDVELRIEVQPGQEWALMVTQRSKK